ncbi:DgyrCDS1044 [Dimorphilus gyrociliatus]|uniref:DgyrCDS1044 n=1 Tax=Dimorphilus gyrociliatus TaxID=2664684 RepID=A0A7I8V637_9ANNE|nr:DgyrCDS1044 [Dimorphilus gyrociliatus]
MATAGGEYNSRYEKSVAEQQKINAQLRNEAQIPRKSASVAIEEMIKFCEEQAEKDVMISGFRKLSDNPYREKSGCIVL